MISPRQAAARHTIREAIRNTVLPRLTVGATVPPAPALSRALGLSRVAAWKHLRGVLDDAGVVVRREAGAERSRLVVERMPG